MIDSTNGYRAELCKAMIKLRSDAGFSVRDAAHMLGVRLDQMEAMETGQHTLSAIRVIRLCEVYGADPLATLVAVAQTVLGDVEAGEFEALSLFCGVSPARWSSGGPLFDSDDIPAYDAAEVRNVVSLPHNHPRRERCGLALARQYNSGASLTLLASETGVSFGTIRNLLLEAGTKLRPPRGRRVLG